MKSPCIVRCRGIFLLHSGWYEVVLVFMKSRVPRTVTPLLPPAAKEGSAGAYQPLSKPSLDSPCLVPLLTVEERDHHSVSPSLISSGVFPESEASLSTKNSTEDNDSGAVFGERRYYLGGIKKAGALCVPAFFILDISTRLVVEAEVCCHVWAEEDAFVVEVFFNAQELVVFSETVGAGERTGFDLTGVHCHSEVCDKAIFSFTGTVGDNS